MQFKDVIKQETSKSKLMFDFEQLLTYLKKCKK